MCVIPGICVWLPARAHWGREGPCAKNRQEMTDDGHLCCSMELDAIIKVVPAGRLPESRSLNTPRADSQLYLIPSTLCLGQLPERLTQLLHNTHDPSQHAFGPIVAQSELHLSLHPDSRQSGDGRNKAQHAAR